MSAPEWLPKMMNVNGEPDVVFAALYQIFDRDFHQEGCCYEARPISWDQRVIEPPYEEGFWHLITRDDHRVADRRFDPRRAERLPWCKPTITNCGDAQVLVWDNETPRSPRRVRTYLWLEQLDYVVILEKRSMGGRALAVLVTAYHVDGERSRRRLRDSYKQRL